MSKRNISYELRDDGVDIPHVEGGQGRSAADVERDGWIGIFLAIGIPIVAGVSCFVWWLLGIR